MKLNWGNALLIFFIIYISLLVRIVIKSFSVDHTLVVDNYYEYDIKYQEKVNKINNRLLLEQDLKIIKAADSDEVRLDFGYEGVNRTANINLYRPSNKKADFSKTYTGTDQQMSVSLEDLDSGLWKIQVEWSDRERTYYKEETLYL